MNENNRTAELGGGEVIKRLLVFMKPYTAMMIITIIVGTSGSVLNILIPGQISKFAEIIQDGIGSSIDMGAVKSLGIRCVIILIALFFCNLFYSRRMEKCAQYVARDIRAALNDKLNRVALICYDRISAGDLIARTSVDVEHICIAISKSIGPLLINVVLLVGAIIFMFIRCVPMALCVIVSVLAGTLVSMYVTSKTIPMRTAQRMAQARMNIQIDETLTGFVVVKSYNAENDLVSSFNASNDSYVKSMQKSQFANNILTPLMSLVNNITYVVICLVGSFMMVKGIGGVDISVIVAFILYSRMLSSPLNYFAGILGMLSITLVSSRKILELLDIPENVDEGQKSLPEVRGEVAFKDVRFGYNREREIIHGFNATIRPGMKVAIVGPTGAGKSTLVNLLMRFYETDSGSISIDGVDVKELPGETLHDILGMVMQESFLFEASIRDNILYAAPGAGDDELQDVIHKCGLSYLISTMPEGLDTVLSAQTAVSAGQRQLITIARTMIKNPAILILDEATSSVDTRTEFLIQKALDELTKDRTSFVIAHRLSTIKNADVIFVLNEGDIVETGNHEELLAAGGLYADLYHSQFEAA